MMPTNFWIIFLVPLVSFVVGSIWYGPLFGKKWQALEGVTDEEIANTNMVKVMGLAYVFAFFVALLLQMVVIHQYGLSGMFGMLPDWSEPGSELWRDLNALNAKYGIYERHLHFGHGAFHGGFFGLLFVGPILATHANFKRTGWRLAAIHTGFWVVTLALMGGLICQFTQLPLPN